MTSPKVIRNQIISLLTTANPKNGDGKGVVKWFKARPPRSRWPGFPFGWVEALLGPQEPPVGSKAEVIDVFFIVVFDKHIDAEKADDSVLDFTESIEAALDDSPSIGGLVARSYVANREKDKDFLDNNDYSYAAIRITLKTHRRE